LLSIPCAWQEQNVLSGFSICVAGCWDATTS
jgi:hypothetical protein